MQFEELAERVCLEESEFLELVELFAETSVSDLGKLQSAIEQEDTQQVVETAHSIKGASGNLGFQNVYEVAKGIEMNARQNILEGSQGAANSLKEKIELIAKSLEEGS